MKIFNKIKETLKKNEEEKYLKIAKNHLKRIEENPTEEQIKEIMDLAISLRDVYPKVAKIYFKKIENYEPLASMSLALYYKNNDNKMYEKYCLKAANKGNKIAQKSLIIFYAENNNEEKMIEWYEKFENKDDYDILSYMSNYYTKINDYKKVKEINIKIFKNEKNDIYSPNCLGDVYFNEKNYELAEKYYKIGLQRGNNDSKEKLLNIYYNTNDIKKYEEFIKEHNIENPNYFNDLANIYLKNRDYSNAEKYLLLLLEKYEMKNCYYNLAIINQSKGNISNYKKYITKGAEYGDNECMFSLAMSIYSEKNMYTNEVDSWLKKSSEKGNIQAMYELGLFAEEENRIEDSKKWYKKAVEKGHTTAMNNLANIYNDEGKNEKAMSLYIKAAEQNNPLALINIAMYYEKEKNIKMAKQYYNKAINILQMYKPTTKLEIEARKSLKKLENL